MELYVIDRTAALYRLLAPNFSPVTTIPTPVVTPVAMAIDIDGNLLVLDRGTGSGAAAPQIRQVNTATLTTTSHALTKVIEPLSLLVLASGDLIIGDAGTQQQQQPPLPGDLTGNLVRVNRSNPMSWVETVVLPIPPAGPNPLVAPTGVVAEDATHLLVLDVGLKPFSPDPAAPFLCDVAEPAVIYRVDLGVMPPAVTRASETGQFVFPTGMVLGNGTLYICDPGEPEVAGIKPRLSRALPHEFAVLIHFCKQRLPSLPQDRQPLEERIRGGIGNILDQQKGAQTLYSIVTEI
jgi:hypothetical protein